MNDKRVFWEWLKYNIRKFTIQFSKTKAKQRNTIQINLENELRNASKLYEQNSSKENYELYESIKMKLEEVYEYKVNGIITRARIRWYENGEKSTKYFLRLQKRNYCRKIIRKLRIQNIEITDPHKILYEQAQFYKTLYTSKNPNLNSEEAKSFFLQSNIPKLTEARMKSCEGILTMVECKEILKTFKNGKTPGNDGLPIEFYKIFWDEIGQDFIQCMTHNFQIGEMSTSQKQAVITLIDKKEKDRELLENWRPISLINVDVKIASKAIANRIRKCLPDLIHFNQTAYVSNRYIGDTLRSLIDIMNYTRDMNIPGLLLFVDFEKAFDSIEWSYMFEILKVFNFGPDIQNWVKMFYTNISSCVINNGVASKQFFLSRGVRQGDPLSPYLFTLAVELLSIAVRNDNLIKGIKIESKETKLAQYADDTTAILNDEDSAFNFLEKLKQFEKVSGLKINYKKTEAMWIGAKRNCKDTPLQVKWPFCPIKVLGVHLTYDQSLFRDYNFDHLVPSIEKIINIWKQRNLTVYGKVIVAKTFLISKLNFIARIVSVPIDIIERVEKIISNFLWNGPDKIKRKASYNTYDNGGLNLTHISTWIKAQKLSWIKRFLDEEIKADWKEYLGWLLKETGGKWFLYCNFETSQIPKDNFYREIVETWKELKEVAGVSSGEYILWNNKNIQINNKPVYYDDYFQSGIVFVSDLCKKDAEEILKRNPNFLKYLGLKAASRNSLCIFMCNEKELNRTQYFRDCLSIICSNKQKRELICVPTKELYTLFLNRICINPTCFGRLKEKFHLTERDIQWSFKNLHQIITETKLKDFQFRCLHSILNVKYILKKKQILNDDSCSFCSMQTETIDHLFF